MPTELPGLDIHNMDIPFRRVADRGFIVVSRWVLVEGYAEGPVEPETQSVSDQHMHGTIV